MVFDAAQSASAQTSPLVDRALVVVGWIATGLFAYWAGARQKHNDRKGDFYKESVVSPLMEEIDRFFDTNRQRLLELSKNPAAAGGKATARVVSKCYLEFSEELRRLGDAIEGRVHTFDPEAAERVAVVVDELDDRITAWLFSTKPREDEIVRRSLHETKRQLIRNIYKAKLTILN